MTQQTHATIYEVQETIPANTLPSAPLKIHLPIGAPFITRLTTYINSTTAFNQIYWRLSSGGVTLYPGGTSQPNGAGVPSGWASAPYPSGFNNDVFLEIPGPNWAVDVEFLNLSAAGVDISILISAANETLTGLVKQLIEAVSDLTIRLAGK